MAAPDLVTPASIYSKTAVLAATTAPTAVVANAAASGKAIRIVSLVVSNVDATTAYTVTVDHYRGTTARHVCKNMSVPITTAVVILGRDAPIYLEEGDQIRVTASANSKIEAICSYEEIS